MVSQLNGKILVVGDLILDRYIQGSVGRISPEAPVPVVRLDKVWSSPGGAGHVAACLSGLGCRVMIAGLIGKDRDAIELKNALQATNMTESFLIESDHSCTITKTRVIAGNYHQLIRLDQEPDPSDWGDAPEHLLQLVLPVMQSCDAIVLADYDKGAITNRTIPILVREAQLLGKPIIVDPKKVDFGVYAGASILMPNVLETERALNRRLIVENDFEVAATELRAKWNLRTMLITRSSQGMTGADELGLFHIPARVREVADVTGAGDTVVAVVAASLAMGGSIREACELASIAAGIAVSHPGTYVVTAEELRSALIGHQRKILSWSSMKAVLDRKRQRGQRIVFTNGCFDILHAGHLQCLQEARSLGDLLVVGLNSDKSVRGLKGASRPIVPQEHRAALLAGLECVDFVVQFDEATPEQLIQFLTPDVLVKGGDYDPLQIAGSEFVRSNGGEVKVLSMAPGLSTTNLVKRIIAEAQHTGLAVDL